MQTLPDSLLEIVKEAATGHPGDPEGATEWAWKQWRKDGAFQEWLEFLAKSAIRSKINDATHSTLSAMRKAAGVYGGRAKVSIASEAVNRVESMLYLDFYQINNNVLGDIHGKALTGLAKTEQAKADGSAFNARLCTRLADIVPADKKVRECVSEARVRKLFKELGKKTTKPAKRKVRAVA